MRTVIGLALLLMGCVNTSPVITSAGNYKATLNFWIHCRDDQGVENHIVAVVQGISLLQDVKVRIYEGCFRDIQFTCFENNKTVALMDKLQKADGVFEIVLNHDKPYDNTER